MLAYVVSCIPEFQAQQARAVVEGVTRNNIATLFEQTTMSKIQMM